MTRRAGVATRGALLVVLVALFAACRRAEPPDTASPSPSAPRIVVVAPAAAEILDRLGAVDLIVGVGDFVDWPPAVAKLPKVGAYDSPSVERVLALRANLLFTARGVPEGPFTPG